MAVVNKTYGWGDTSDKTTNIRRDTNGKKIYIRNGTNNKKDVHKL